MRSNHVRRMPRSGAFEKRRSSGRNVPLLRDNISAVCFVEGACCVNRWELSFLLTRFSSGFLHFAVAFRLGLLSPHKVQSGLTARDKAVQLSKFWIERIRQASRLPRRGWGYRASFRRLRSTVHQATSRLRHHEESLCGRSASARLSPSNARKGFSRAPHACLDIQSHESGTEFEVAAVFPQKVFRLGLSHAATGFSSLRSGAPADTSSMNHAKSVSMRSKPWGSRTTKPSEPETADLQVRTVLHQSNAE